MNKVLVVLVASAFAFSSVAAMADDKTPAQPVGQAKQYNGNDPYGTTPVRTSRGTPLIGDFGTPTITPEEKTTQPKALPSGRPQMGVPVDRRYREPLPPGGPAQRDPAKSNP